MTYQMKDTVKAHLDRATLLAEAEMAFFDAYVPGWEARQIHPEDRNLVDESDVTDADEAIVHRFGGVSIVSSYGRNMAMESRDL